MSTTKSLIVLLAALSLALVAIAEPAKDSKPAAAPEMKLPPGWTEADMKACMAAGVPGKMHEHLSKDVGQWQGKNTMWMYPGAEPIKCDTTATVTSLFDGRYIKSEMAGEMPGMGPYKGLAIYGFDNVSQKFVCAWIDNMGTGMTNGVGELSADGKTLTWTFNYNCPVTKKPAIMREIETVTGPNTKTVEMYSTEPKSGKEFRTMVMELTKKDEARAEK